MNNRLPQAIENLKVGYSMGQRQSVIDLIEESQEYWDDLYQNTMRAIDTREGQIDSLEVRLKVATARANSAEDVVRMVRQVDRDTTGWGGPLFDEMFEAARVHIEKMKESGG